MAKSFLTDLNLNNNVLLNAKIQAWGSAPTGTTNPNGSGTAVVGQISSYLGALWIFNGTAWVTVGGGKVTIGNTDVNVNGSAVTTFTGLSSVTSTAFVGALTGNASTATTLATARTINGTSFDGSANITVTAAAGTLTGNTLNSGVTASSLTSVGTLANLTVTNTITGSVSGNAGTATILATSRSINGVAFDGSANITVTAAAGTLTGNTLNSGVTASSLTSVGTLGALTMGGNIAMGNNKITGLGTPTADTDAATKLYVDQVAAGLHVHPSVNYATTGALGTTGNLVGGTITTTYNNGTSGVGATLTIATSSNWTNIQVDGQTVTVNDRILIKNQGGTASNLQNGIYTVTSVGAVGNTTSFVFTRAVDADQSPEIDAGDLTYVVAGTVNGGDGYVQVINGVTVGTTAIQWSQFSGSGAVPIATTTDVGIASFPAAQFSVSGAGAVTIGTINAGVVNAGTGQISGARGGTGVDNGTKTITVSGNTIIGSSTHTVQFTTSGNTNVTLPTTGTLAINSGPQTFTGVQTFTSPSITTSLTTGSTSFDLLNTTATTINFAGAATTLNLNVNQSSTSTINLGTGGSSGGQTKTINIGTGADTASAIVVNIATSANTSNAPLVNIGSSSTTTTITGAVRVPTVGTSGFVKAGASGALSAAAIAYSDLPTSSLTGATTAGIARKTTGAGTGTSATSFAINHGFGQWVTAQLFLTSTGEAVEVDITNASTNSGTTTFAAASNTNWTLYTYVIIG
jgi:hypothetical protein